MIDQVLDLSHHNTDFTFPDLYKAGIRGVIHKATQGLANTDPTYRGRAPIARGCGLMWGAYHFGTGADGKSQAKRFLDVVQPDERTLLALDFEPNTVGATMTLRQAVDFVLHVKEATGRYPGFYSGNLIKETLGNKKHEVLEHCWLWLAHYADKPVVPANWPNLTLWQYTESGTVAGLGCDRNRFNGDLNALRKLWGYPELSASIGVPQSAAKPR